MDYSTISFEELNTAVLNASPPRAGSNFSTISGCPPLGIRLRIRGLIVKGVYGDGKRQEDLREQYLQQVSTGEVTDKLLCYGNPICSDQAVTLAKWEESLREYATKYIKETTVGVKKGTKLAYSPILREDHSFKVNVPQYVAESCRSEIGVDNLFEIGHGVYDVVFKISGMWRNNQNYGYTLSALRIKRVSVISSSKRKAPEDYSTVVSKWEYNEDEVEETPTHSEA